MAWCTSKPAQSLYVVAALGEGYPINGKVSKYLTSDHQRPDGLKSTTWPEQ